MDKKIKNSIIVTNILLALIYFWAAWGLKSFDDYMVAINLCFEKLVGFLAPILFFDISFGAFDILNKGEIKEVALPLIVIVLLLGALIFTFYFRFINIRAFKHSIDIIKGKYDNPDDPGQISHFQALTSALSATIGLGNIAGVAIAVSLGGAGAVFWMILIAFFSKVNEDGSISGGPMYYLEYGLKDRGFTKFGKILGSMYAVFIIGGAFGGGNMFQANQSNKIFGELVGFHPFLFGILLALLVAVVIIGGIKRIGKTTEKIVPLMVTIYVIASLYIIFANFSELPNVVQMIFSEAFSQNALFGGFVGILVTGIKRAVFSNEGGVGSASIAHSAAKTNEPVREGIVAMIGPFIDTIVVCFMTASVILITRNQNPLWNPGTEPQGAELTSAAFESVISWFPYVLAIVVFLFSFSTIISWYYYGNKGWKYLFGEKSINTYKGLYLGFVVLGAIATLDSVVTFSDMMILSCAFPNIIGAMFLLPKIKEKLTDYWKRYQEGTFKTYK